MKHCLLIEGYEKAFGTHAPSWFDGELIDGLLKRPKLSQTIDPLGGIADIGAASFELSDPCYDLAKAIRFNNSNRVQITAPSPLLYDDEDLTLSSTTHPTRKKMSLPGNSSQRVVLDPVEWDFYESYTWEFWYYHVPSAATTNYMVRKNFQFFILAYNTGSFPNNLYVAAYPGGAGQNFFHNNGSMTTEGWYHIGLSYDHIAQTMKVWVNNVKVEYTGVVANLSKPTEVTSLWGFGTTSPAQGDIARMRVWKRALSDDEWGDAYDGKPVDDTDIFFNSEWMEPWGDQITSAGNLTNHIPQAPGSTWLDRDFIRGDKLYLPRDTARVLAVSGSDVNVERQVDSCLEDGYCAYYQQEPSNDHMCFAYTDNPHQWEGRLCAYYIDGELQYLGYLNNMAQRGKAWKFDTKSIINPLREGFKHFSRSLPLKHSDGTDWYIGTIKTYLKDSWIGLTNEINAGITLDQLPYEAVHDTAGVQIYETGSFDLQSGYVFDSDDGVEFQDAGYAEGSKDCFYDDAEAKFFVSTLNPDKIQSMNPSGTGIKPYGALLGKNAKIKTEESDPSVHVGAYLRVKEGSIVKVESYDAGSGYLTLSGTYDEDLNLRSTRTCGYTSDDPILLDIIPTVHAENLTSLVYSLLTSTGSGTNGDFDIYSGLYGLGLPESIVNTLCTWTDFDHPLQVNLKEGKIIDDLQAMGVSLVFRDGVFKLQRMSAPAINLATKTIGAKDTLAGNRSNLNFGFFHPLKSISYEGSLWNNQTEMREPYTIKISVQNSNIFFGSTGRDRSWKSQTGSIITASYFRERILKILRWFNNYAPTLDLVVPNHSIEMGDIVNIEVNDIVGQGDYGVTNMPGIVVALTDDYGVRVVLNTADTASQAAWAPSWEIDSYATTVLTLRKGGALAIESLVTLPFEGQIIRADGIAIGNYTINSVTDDNTVVLATAPAYLQSTYRGILTLPDYTTSTIENIIDSYVWAANSSGVMSNSDAGKELA